MLEAVFLLIKKMIGVGAIGAVGLTGLGVAGDAFDTVKDYLLISTTNIEMDGAHKVLLSFYLRDNHYPKTLDELWSWFEENYDKEKLPDLKTDGWFTEYNWITKDYEIRSAGPDRKHQTRDDFGIGYPSNVKR